MADNGLAASGPTIAWDDIAGVAYQRVKITWGVDGTVVDASASNPLPVTAASLPLPSGASTETTLSAVSGKLPATLGQKAMSSSMAVVIASDQGTVPVQAGATVRVSTNFTRPADTTAYASGDLVANSTTAGSVTAMSFAGAVRVSGGGGLLRRLKLRKSTTSTVNASFRMLFYSASQTSAGGDNAALNLPGIADYLGKIEVTMDQALNDGACGFGVPSVGSDIGIDTPSGTTIYGYLVATAAYTPGNAEVFTAELEIIQD